MDALPAGAAGAITIALFVVLGILVYPALLRSVRGRWIVGATTVALAVLFAAFERAVSGEASLVLTTAWALAPLAAGVIVWRLTGAR